MMRALAIALALLAASGTAPGAVAQDAGPARQTMSEAELDARVQRVMARTPLIDGHNDWPDAMIDNHGDKRWTVDLTRLGDKTSVLNTDIARLREGRVGGQFWSVWANPTLPGEQQVMRTLELIDFVKSLSARYPETFVLARTAADVRRAHAAGKIASLIGVEGGGQIAGNLSVLRTYADLGAGYLTLTHAYTTDWADSATDNPRHDGLSEFGVQVVRELNRLGVLVDLSHVSEATMRDALAVTKAPVIFSHSGARSIGGHPRNVSDAVLRLVAANGGVVMVDYAPPYVSDAFWHWQANAAAEKARLNSPPFTGFAIGQPDKAEADYAAWLKANPAPVVTLAQVADHFDHVRKVAGIDHVGIGADYDGVGMPMPVGLEDVSTYPALLKELMRRGWSDADIAKLAGGNVLRVMEAAEKVKAAMAREAWTQGRVPAPASAPSAD